MRYYIIRDGERIFRKTEAAIKRLAKQVANEIKSPVRVYGDHTSLGFGGKRAGVASRKRVVMRRNPTGLQVLSKMKGVNLQITWVSAPPRRARGVAYASTLKEAQSLKRQLEGGGASHVVIKPQGWMKNPARRSNVGDDALIRKIYHDGFKTAQAGKRVSENPYNRGSPPWRWWRDGWEDGKVS